MSTENQLINKTEAPVFSDLTSKSPQMMSELMAAFVKHPAFTDRAKIRMQMKALLDIVSHDTTYPPVPKIEKKGSQWDEGDQPALPEPTRMNEEMLGVPPGDGMQI